MPSLPATEFITPSSKDTEAILRATDALAKLGGTGKIDLPSEHGPDWPFSVTVTERGISVVYGYRAECFSWGALYPAVPIAA